MSELEDRYAQVAQLAQSSGSTVAVAESLTSGAVATRLGAAPNASEWFAGGIVAYHSRVKFELLGVDEGPVVTEDCARQMCTGTARLLQADVVVALTGVGGPDPDEGKPAGTVCLAVLADDVLTSETVHFEGDPGEVIHQSTERSVNALLTALTARLNAGERTRPDPLAG